MSYLSIDIFNDKTKAEVTAQAYKNSGRQNVVIKEKGSILVNDCRQDPPKALVNIGGSPLFIVSSEG